MSDMAEDLNLEEFLDSVVIATRNVIIPPEDDQFLDFIKTKNSELSKFNINNCGLFWSRLYLIYLIFNFF